MEKREGLGKCKESSSRAWEKAKYRSKKARKVEYDRRKEL